MTKGYLGQESEAFYEDEQGSWLVIGDAVVIEKDRNVRIIDRYKDIIIRGGENISPAVIEDELSRIGGLAAQVVGIHDDVAGEVPVAIAQTRKDFHVPGEEMKQRVVKAVGPSYALDQIIHLEALQLKDFPRTMTGNLQPGLSSRSC